jgi:hypothetical protein
MLKKPEDELPAFLLFLVPLTFIKVIVTFVKLLNQRGGVLRKLVGNTQRLHTGLEQEL